VAIKGRRPVGSGVSNNRHAPVHRWTDVESTPFTGGPKLPQCRANGQRWSAAMRQRWAAWSSMPHCRLWGPADWEFGLDTLEIAARFHDTGAAAWSTELRYRERVMGTTYDARQGMRIRYIDLENVTTASVLSLNSFRDSWPSGDPRLCRARSFQQPTCLFSRSRALVSVLPERDW
jgi:hypothetical protein